MRYTRNPVGDYWQVYSGRLRREKKTTRVVRQNVVQGTFSNQIRKKTSSSPLLFIKKLCTEKNVHLAVFMIRFSEKVKNLLNVDLDSKESLYSKRAELLGYHTEESVDYPVTVPILRGVLRLDLTSWRRYAREGP